MRDRRRAEMPGMGRLVVLSGFSGAGKGTIVNELIRSHPDKYALSVSVTTRPPREGEREGEHYFFRTRDEFLGMIERGELLEYASYVGSYYGTPIEYVREKLMRGQCVLLEIEIQGGMQVKEKYPEALMLFVTAPSLDELLYRLSERDSEDEIIVQRRLSQAVWEAEHCRVYDHIIVNDKLDEAVQMIDNIISGEASGADERGVCVVEAVREELRRRTGA